MDKLENMMELQDKFQKRLGVDFTALNAVERAASMRDNFVYLDQELQEALYEMPFFKHWKDYSGMSDEEVEKAWAKVKMELIDAFHFFMNMLLCAGMSAEEVYKTYVAKNKENHRRQDEGYTANKSYKDQLPEEVLHVDPSCSVCTQHEIISTDTFVAVLWNDDGSSSVAFNADLITMAKSIGLLRENLKSIVDNMSDIEKAEAEKAVDEAIKRREALL